jgi:hypothetical protein
MFLTAEPHAHVRFRRAIERRALWLSEDAARELPNLPLEDALPTSSGRLHKWSALAAADGDSHRHKLFVPPTAANGSVEREVEASGTRVLFPPPDSAPSSNLV